MQTDTTEHSLMLARASLHSQQPLARGTNSTLALLLLDRSSSMAEYGQTPRLAANECIQAVQNVPGAENARLAVFTFGNEVTLDVRPQPVKAASPIQTYLPNGGTKLYEAVYVALYVALEHHAVEEGEGRKTEVVISVITDGQDTTSTPKYWKLMRQLSEQARRLGFKLQVIGIGIDSHSLAEDLGFESALAKTVAPTAQGVRDAAAETSVLFEQSVLFSLRDVRSSR